MPEINMNPTTKTNLQNLIDKPLVSIDSNSKEPAEIAIVHSFNARTLQGAYTIEFINGPWKGESKKSSARSGEEVLLTAIARALTGIVHSGAVRITTSNEGVAMDLDRVKLWRRRRAGWARADGKPLKNWRLLEKIENAMRGRSVTFVYDEDSHLMADIRAKTRTTLKKGNYSTAKY